MVRSSYNTLDIQEASKLTFNLIARYEDRIKPEWFR